MILSNIFIIWLTFTYLQVVAMHWDDTHLMNECFCIKEATDYSRMWDRKGAIRRTKTNINQITKN